MTVLWRSIGVVLCVSLLLGGMEACSGMPRIVVLHDPLGPEEHVTLGTAYEEQGRRDLAVEEYRAALKGDQGYVPALVALGNHAFTGGALGEAESYYRQALAIDPEHPGANNNLAMLHVARGEALDEAERLARRALAQKGPLQPYVWDTLAHIYLQQGRYQEAKAALEEAEAGAP
jgi:tetratricopeptide (TPR) repeat protein